MAAPMVPRQNDNTKNPCDGRPMQSKLSSHGDMPVAATAAPIQQLRCQYNSVCHGRLDTGLIMLTWFHPRHILDTSPFGMMDVKE